MYGEAGGLGELAAAPFLPQRVPEQITCCQFDQVQEGLWASTEGGVIGQGLSQLLLAQAACPTLDRYCSVAAHSGRVLGLRSVGEGAVSVSGTQLCLHASGGVPRLHFKDEVGDLSCVELESRGVLQAAVGRDGGGIMLFDLAAGRPTGKVDTGGKGVVALCGPVARGALVAATSDGHFSLCDSRAGEGAASLASAPLLAHAGGFAAVDGRGNFVATAGYTTRMGRLLLENHVKVFDVRMAPRMLSSLPFAPGPALLRFHPKFSGTLLLGSASGLFTLADTQGLGMNAAMYQVETEGDLLLCCDVSPSGECFAFGGSGGYLHLWANSNQPAVCGMGQVLTLPEPPVPLMSLGEEDPLSLPPIFYSLDGTPLLSDVASYQTAACGLAPRTLDASLLKNMKQADFVGYIPNPKYRREAAPGAAARAVSSLRNARIQPRPEEPDAEVARAERARKRAAAGGIVLPGRYRRVAVQQAAARGQLRFEEFDFSYHNKTPFAGLENDIANCYTNALLQVLFFTPPIRDAMLRHVPDPASEFSLSGELSFLFRMMATPGATICQASNLLRALRQSREAAALGLLEGVRGERGSADIEVEAHKDPSLASRVQSLARFVLEQLHKEAAAAAAGAAAASPVKSVPGGKQAATTTAAAAAAAAGSSSGAGDVVEAVYGMTLAQRTQCLSRKRPDILKETHTYQVDLQYPSVKDWPHAPLVPTPTPLRTAIATAAAATAGLIPPISEAGHPEPASKPQGVGALRGTASPPGTPERGVAAHSSSAAVVSKVAAKLAVAGDGAVAAVAADAASAAAIAAAAAVAGGAPAAVAQPGGSPLVAAAAAAAATRPSFSEVLQSSLHTRSEMRAWFDDAVKYQFVRQERIPRQLPQVLVLNCGLKDRGNLRWWQPYDGPDTTPLPPQQQYELQETQQEFDQADGQQGSSSCPAAKHRRRSWLPPALAITTDPEGWVVTVEEAAAVEELLRCQPVAEVGPAAPGKAVGAGNAAAAAVDSGRADPAGSLGGEGNAASPAAAAAAAAGGPEERLQPHQGAPGGVRLSSRAAYQLTAVICHIRDEDEIEEGRREGAASGGTQPAATPGPTGSDYEGHLVAHIRVPPTYYASQQQQTAGRSTSGPTSSGGGGGGVTASGGPGGSHGGSQQQAAQQGQGLPGRQQQQGAGRAGSLGVTGALAAPASPQGLASLLLPSIGGPTSPARPPSATGGSPSPPLLKSFPVALEEQQQQEEEVEVEVEGQEKVTPPASPPQQPPPAAVPDTPQEAASAPSQEQPSRGEASAAAAAPVTAAAGAAAVTDAADTAAAAAAADGGGEGGDAPGGLSPREAEIIRAASESLAMNGSPSSAAEARHKQGPPRPGWLVFNDFHISPCSEEEVGELFGGQKVPCLLYYTQVSLWEQAAHRPPAAPAPVLTPEGFLHLCKAPPLQGPKVRLHRPTFTPLTHQELPHPGLLLALDAEFVAYSPPDKRLRRGVEVEVRPSRLGLARVSVVRGAGPGRGSCCIDDYIRGVELVYDFLTKYSGLVPGDLDPSVSPHYLTTLRRAYTKLRYLVDSGCVFVGHGLKKDFRMINIVVPPNQIIDTVDLFHAKRSRKLSLRFLASFLLKANIQTHTHDSIEDACTALRLYEVYQRLVAEGGFEVKLQDMYDWGKVHGWDPVVWKDGKPHPAAQQPLAGSTAGAALGAGGGPGPGQQPALHGVGPPMQLPPPFGPPHPHHQQHPHQRQQHPHPHMHFPAPPMGMGLGAGVPPGPPPMMGPPGSGQGLGRGMGPPGRPGQRR